MRVGRCLSFAVLAPLWCAVLAVPASGSELLVFAAASLKTAFDQIGAEFEEQTGQEVTFAYAGTATLARQIEQGAPADLIASAHPVWIDYLTERDLVAAERTVDFASNRLVLIAPAEMHSGNTPPADLDLGDAPGFLALAEGTERIATALASAIPAGIYAREAMESLGIWDDLSPRLAQADSVRSALQFVARSETPLGIVYASDAHSEPRVRVLSIIDPELHTPIRYTLALVGVRGEEAGAAQAFSDFVLGEAAGEVLAESGFQALVRR